MDSEELLNPLTVKERLEYTTNTEQKRVGGVYMGSQVTFCVECSDKNTSGQKREREKKGWHLYVSLDKYNPLPAVYLPIRKRR